MQPKVSSKAKKVQTSRASKQKKEITFPLERDNFMIIGLGILVVVVGYFLMSGGSVDGFMPTVVSPIFLVLGYCVIIPFGILKKTKADTPAETTDTSSQPALTNTISSNIKTG